MRMNRTPKTAAALTIAAILSSTLGAGKAQAISFTITNPDPGLASELNALAAEINSKFSGNPETNFIGSMAEASRGANRSIGSDGVSQTQTFSISTTAGVGVASKGSFGSFEANNGLPGIGLGVQPAVTVGFSAKHFNKIATLGLDPTRVTYYVSFGSINLSDVTPEAGFKLSLIHI